MVIDGFIINEAKRGIFRAVEVDSQMVQWVIDNMDHYTEPCFDTNKALCEGTWRSECTKTPKVMAKCRKTCGTCSKTSSGGGPVKVDEEEPPSSEDNFRGLDGETGRDSPPCEDLIPQCTSLKTRPEDCETSWAVRACKETCGLCKERDCRDLDPDRCHQETANDILLCTNNKWIVNHCRESCGTCQTWDT